MSFYKSLIGLVMMGLILAFVGGCSDDETGVGPEPDKAGLRVIHASYDAPSVEVNVDGTTAFTNLEYGSTGGYARINSGAKNITVTPAGASSPVVIDVDVTLETDRDYTVFAVGDLDNIEPISSLDVRTPVTDKVKVRIVHASPDAPNIDLKLDSGSGTPIFSNVAYKQISNYIEVDPGTYTFAVTATGSTDEVVVFDPVTFSEGQVFTVLVIGTFDNTDGYPLAVKAFFDNNDGNAVVNFSPKKTSLRLIHTTYDAGAVDLIVDGGVTISNLTYGFSSSYKAINSGTRNITVTSTGTSSPALFDLNLDVAANDDYTIVAVDVLSQIEAIYTIDDLTPSVSGAKVRLIHASPDAPAVDIKLNSGSGTTVFSNSTFKSISDYTEIVPGTYTFVVTPSGSSDELRIFNAMTLEAGKIYTVLITGTFDNTDLFPLTAKILYDNFGIYFDNGYGNEYAMLTPKQSKLRVIHNSYDAPAVDVQIDGLGAFSNLAYGISSGYAGINTGTRNITVTQTGTTSPALIDVSPTFAAGIDYTIFAVDELSSIAAIYASDNRTLPASGFTKFRFVNAVSDAPNLDLKKSTTAMTDTLFANVPFTGIRAYKQIGYGDFTFVLTEASSTQDLYIFQPIAMERNMIYTVVAQGTLDTTDAYPFRLRIYADNDAGITYRDAVLVPPKAKIRVIHTSYDASAVDVRLDDVVTMAALNYGNATTYTMVNSGLRNFVLTPAGAASPEILSVDLMFQKNFEYTIFALDQLTLINAVSVVDLRSADAAMAKVRFVHALPDAPAVDVKSGSGASTAIFANAAFKDVTDYALLTPGGYSFVITGAGTTDELVVYNSTSLVAGGVYTIVVYGTFNSGDATPMVARVFNDKLNGNTSTDLVAATTNLRVIHTSYDAPNVDIYVDGSSTSTNLAYGLSSGYFSKAAGTRNVTVAPTGSPTPVVIDVDVTMAPSSYYTIFAVDELALIDAVYSKDERTPVSTQAKMRFVHAAPDAPAVDIKLNAGTGTTLFANASFKDITAYAQRTGGSFSFVITAAGDTNEVIAYQPVTLSNNNAYSIVAHGTLDPNDAYPFGVRIYTDNTTGTAYVDLVPAPTTASVRVIHTSYDSPDVDVWIDGSVAISGLVYGNSSGYNTLDVGTRNIQVTPTGLTVPVVIDTNLYYARNTYYTAIAIDEFALIEGIQVIDDRTPNPTQAKIRFVHASPDAPAVDIKVWVAMGPGIIENASFKEASSYIGVDAGPYIFIITETGSDTPLVSYQMITLNSGSTYTFVAHGTIDGGDSYPFSIRVFNDGGAGDTYFDLVEDVKMAGN